MKSQPLVTVAIPTCNRSEHYLRSALESVLTQSYRRLEVVIADNASSLYDVEAVIRSYGDERVRYHRHARNIGLAQNWSWCIREASGDWIGIFHDDDVMVRENVANVVRAAQEHPSVAFQCSTPVLIDAHGAEIPGKRWFETSIEKNAPLPGKSLIEYLFLNWANKICCPSVFIRRDLYRACLPFSRSPLLTTDINMWLRALSSGRHFLVQSDAGVRYRVHSQQLTTAHNSRVYEYLLIEFGRVVHRLSRQHQIRYLTRLAGYVVGRRVHIPANGDEVYPFTYRMADAVT